MSRCDYDDRDSGEEAEACMMRSALGTSAQGAIAQAADGVVHPLEKKVLRARGKMGSEVGGHGDAEGALSDNRQKRQRR